MECSRIELMSGAKNLKLAGWVHMLELKSCDSESTGLVHWASAAWGKICLSLSSTAGKVV